MTTPKDFLEKIKEGDFVRVKRGGTGTVMVDVHRVTKVTKTTIKTVFNRHMKTTFKRESGYEKGTDFMPGDRIIELIPAV